MISLWIAVPLASLIGGGAGAFLMWWAIDGRYDIREHEEMLAYYRGEGKHERTKPDAKQRTSIVSKGT